LALLVVLAACGSVGEPLPPLLNIPAKVTDLQVAQLADEAELRWTWPLLTTEGSTLRDLDKFEVRALDIPVDAGPPPIEAFQRLGKTLAVVEGGALPESGAGGEVVVRASLADRLGLRTAFAVRGVSSRGKTAPWSEYVIREILRPAAAPGKPQAESVAAGVQLNWDAVDGAAGYSVERRTGADGEYLAVGSTDRTEYLDEAAPMESALAYRVRSQVGAGAGAVGSKPSPETAIAREDVFPPAVPAELRAVAADDAVELIWSAARDADLAGYEVSRNGEPAHEGLIAAPAFRDESPAAANEYRVRAVDKKGNRSELSDPVTAGGPQ
jgi:hypothetical protein